MIQRIGICHAKARLRRGTCTALEVCRIVLELGMSFASSLFSLGQNDHRAGRWPKFSCDALSAFSVLAESC